MERMDVDQNLENSHIKKTYIKPVVNRIHLVPDEAVLGTCKWGIGVAGENGCNTAGDLLCEYNAGS